jgi:hypothetical protein
MKITWIDHHREPKHPPDPRYPDGVDLDLALDAVKTCTANLPYPAARCGMYVLHCEVCGLRAVASTAGRVDDPKSVKVACRLN